MPADSEVALKHHNVVIPKGDGGVELHPMKAWLRGHPEHMPVGLDTKTHTSYQIRRALLKTGWSIQELPTETRLIPPDTDPVAVDAVIGEEPEETDELSPSAAFALEFQLRDFIAQNIETISVQGTKLKLYIDPAEREGIEYPTAVGPIDILAITATGDFYVFELKRARSPDHAIGQLARYMGWVRHTIGKDKAVHGVIVAKEIGKNLRYAVSVVPNVSLFEYEVEFHLKPAHDMPGAL